MNKVHQSIYDNVVGPALNNLGGIRVGRIVEFNPNTKEATVSYSSGGDITGGESLIKNVGMVRAEGTHEAGPFVGDTVLLGFINNDIKNPIIIGAIDQKYAVSRGKEREGHDGKGSNVSSYYTSRTGESWNVE